MSDELIQSALLSARVARPYYARAIAALTPVVKEGLNTVAVDKYWRLYYDPAWLETLSPAQRGAVIGGHEVEHLLRGHCQRAEVVGALPLNGIAWNICTDAEINDDSDDLPDSCVTPDKIGQPVGLTAEDYYRNLPQVELTVNICGGGSGAGRPQDFEDTKSNGLGQDQIEAIKDQVAVDVKAQADKYPGTVPNHVVMWADSRAKKVAIDWRGMLRRQISLGIQVVAGREMTSRRPHRRQRDGQPLRHGTCRPVPTIGVVIDTSGSMSDSGDVVLGALAEVRKLGTPTVVQCDTEVKSKKKGRVSKFVGGGGTDLTKGIESVKGCDIVVIVTDGYTPWPPSDLNRPLVVLCTTDEKIPAHCHTIRIR